jgi:hypothetical protein
VSHKNLSTLLHLAVVSEEAKAVSLELSEMSRHLNLWLQPTHRKLSKGQSGLTTQAQRRPGSARLSATGAGDER